MWTYIQYWVRMLRCATIGGRAYYGWMTFLLGAVFVGVGAYVVQLRQGFVTTNLSDQVSWGAYIANFTFLVGVAAAAVLLVTPAYVYKRKDVKEVVLVGELLAFSAIVMCLIFVTVDLGRPDRFLHMLPYFGRLNFPESILAWDVIVLSVYLLLNLHIPGYILYKKYLGEEPTKALYLPFIFISIGWAVSIHTVTAFLYSGLGSRPFWNSAILAPRFLISAFASGPAILILVFYVIRSRGLLDVQESVFDMLKRIVAVTLPVNLFLFGAEIFKEFYTDSAHVASMEYLLFGLHGHGLLSPYMWCAIMFSVTATVVFVVRGLRSKPRLVLVACVFCVVGIWIEKGMGLIIPGFIPTPLGDLVEYTPSWVEFFVSLGIWALGAFIFSATTKVALAIQRGTLRAGTEFTAV